MSNIETRALAEDWPDASRYRRGVRLEFSLYVSGVIVVLMLVTGCIVTRGYVSTVTRGVAEKLLVQARSSSMTAGKHILAAGGPDPLMLSNICQRLATDNEDVYWVGITGADNRYLAHTDVKQLTSGAQLSTVQEGTSRRMLREGETFAQRNDSVTITIPIIEQGILVGRLAVASSTRQIQEAQRSSIATVASITAVMLLFGVPATLLLVHRKLRPIGTITHALQKIDFNNITLDVSVPTRNEFGYLAETLRVMGGKLNRAQKDLIEKKRVDRELEIAREIQASILPRSVPQSDRAGFAVSYQSAREVGGDYYDFIEFDDLHLGILVADVSGKSLPGMLVMLMTRDIIRGLTRSLAKPAALLAALNRELQPDLKKGMFVTMFFGVLNRATGSLEFASAGHNPLIVMRNGNERPELIKTKGFPIGMMPPGQFDSRIETACINLQKSDWFIQFTDGLNEGQNPALEEFGMERLLAAVQSCGNMTPDQLVERTLAAHARFVDSAPQYDDMTLLAVKWTGQANPIFKNMEKRSTYAA